MIEAAIRKILADAPAVVALVADRITFVVADQNERRPRLILTLVSAVPGYCHDGKGGWVEGRMQCDCLAPTYPEAKTLAAAARAALEEPENYAGTVAGTEILNLEIEDSHDVPMMPAEGRATPATYGVSFDVRFLHRE